MSAGLNVLHRPLQAVALGLIELFAIAIPLAILGSHLFGLAGVYGAIAASYLAAGVLSWVVVERAQVKLAGQQK